MALTTPVSVTFGSGESAVSRTNSLTGTDYQRTEQDVTVGIGATNLQAGLLVDVSALKAILLLADQSLTVKTNDGSSPDQTLSLAAGVPFFWQANCGITNPLTDDISALYITNASGVATTLYIRVLQDGTP